MKVAAPRFTSRPLDDTVEPRPRPIQGGPRGVGTRVPDTLARWCATLVFAPVYAVMRLLARYAPPHPDVRGAAGADDADPSLSSRRHRTGYVAVLVASLYRRSAVHERLHQHGLSPCKFIPSCTDYGVRAVEKYGLVRGLWLTARRLKRCRPGDPGDYVDFP